MDTQAFRRSLHHSDRYNRRGFDSPTKRAQALEEAYQSDLISSIRDNGFTYTKGRLNIKSVSYTHLTLPTILRV